MIRNGLYHCKTTFLDGVVGGSDGVMVLRDGTLRGGDSFYFCYGTYTCANGKVTITFRRQGVQALSIQENQ